MTLGEPFAWAPLGGPFGIRCVVHGLPPPDHACREVSVPFKHDPPSSVDNLRFGVAFLPAAIAPSRPSDKK